MTEPPLKVRYVISTCLRPSRRLRTFGRDLARALINGYYMTRGKKRIVDLKGLALNLKASRLVIIQARKGNPSKLDFYDATLKDVPFLGSLLLSGVKLVREQKHTRRAPRQAKLVVHYDLETVPLEMRQEMMLIPTLFDLEVSTTEDDRWVMKVSWTGKGLEISFIDREQVLSFGPVMRVRRVVLSTT
jgi:rRNA maturation protein Rpf1